MDEAAEALRSRVDLPILTQRDLPKPALIKAFSDSEQTCLFATAGLFQGVDVPGQTLSPTHHLFHAVLHGLGASEEAVLRWVPDALTILAVAGADIDWDELVGAARRHHCSLLIREGVEHLVEQWRAPIPEFEQFPK